MLGGARRARSLGLMPPLWRECTLEKLAVNAVMAGASPRAFPIIVAAVEAMLDPAFNLYGVQATTHPVAPLVIVNGPYGRAIGLHGGSRLLRSRLPRQRHASGAPSASALERWRRLAGPARHGDPGQPGEVLLLPSPRARRRPGAAAWARLRAEESVVTVYGGEAPHNVNDHVSTTAPRHPQQRGGHRGHLARLQCRLVHRRRASSWWCSGPSTPPPSRRDGLTRADVQRFVFEHARLPLGRSSWAACGACTTGRSGCRRTTDEARAAAGASAEDIFVMVAGGSGQALRGGAQLHLQPGGLAPDPCFRGFACDDGDLTAVSRERV